MRRFLVIFSILLLLALGVWGQIKFSYVNNGAAPSVGKGVVASLGGLRSIAAEVIWFRADRLQRQGRYGELIQLASMLTFLEPNTPEVWTYSAWNLAYNVSANMPLEERWHWVHSGIKLLRDDGLKWNPNDPDICLELNNLFSMKVGAIGSDMFDSITVTNRNEWKKIVESVESRNAWHELRMEADKKSEVEQKYNITDWTNPHASAIYWAHQAYASLLTKESLSTRDKKNLSMLKFRIELSQKLYRKSYITKNNYERIINF